MKDIPIFKQGFQKTYYQGDWKLKNSPEVLQALDLIDWDENERATKGLLGAGITDPENYLFTVTVKLDDGTLLTIPDLLYPVKEGRTADVLGLRLLPIYEEKTDNNGVVIPGKRPTEDLDKFLNKIFYGNTNFGSKALYVVTPHSTSSDNFFTELSDYAKTKAEKSTAHVSAYAFVPTQEEATSGVVTRRTFLERGSIDNVYAYSMLGVDQEAVNLNLALWSRLYYENPKMNLFTKPALNKGGYQFASDYHFDWVINVNLEETLSFAKAWLKRDWVRQELNAQIVDEIRRLPNPKSAPRVAADTPYYLMLQDEESLALYCDEGVSTTNFLGMNVPLTLAYFQRIFGAVDGAAMFDFADLAFQEIQRSAAGIRPGHRPPANAPTVTIVSLKDPVYQNVLAKMRPLWELPGGVRNPAQFTAQVPLFPNRVATIDPAGAVTLSTADATGAAAPALENANRDTDIRTLGLGLPFKPQTTSDILRDVIETYVPYHKVQSAVRTAAIVLNFADKVKERTGILDDRIQFFATQVISLMFKHESNWRFAQISAMAAADKLLDGKPLPFPPGATEPQKTAIRASAVGAQYVGYAAKTTAALDDLAAKFKNLTGDFTQEELQGLRQILKPDEIQKLVDYRASRNTRLYAQLRNLMSQEIVPVLAQTPRTPVPGYSADGGTSFATFVSEATPVLDTANQETIRNPNLILQVLLGEKYVKYNYPPGMIPALGLETHDLNPNVLFTGVATLIDENAVEPQVANDTHAVFLEARFDRFSKGIN